jgi:hypothetical protein
MTLKVVLVIIFQKFDSLPCFCLTPSEFLVVRNRQIGKS